MSYNLASILNIITISHEYHEEVIFMYLRELLEIAPPKKHWYANKGRNGKAKYIWEEKKLKQWLLISNDNEIESLFRILLKEKKLSEEVVFIINGNNEIIDNFYTDKQENDNKIFFSLENWKDNIGRHINYLSEESSCLYLEGYNRNANNDEIIIPPAFFSKGELYKYFQNEILAVCEKRSFTDLRGNYKDEGKLSLKGFIQLEPQFRKDMKITISDLPKEKVYEPAFDHLSGIWELKLKEPLWEGNLLIEKNQKTIYSNQFHLIKNFDFKIHVAENKKIQDLYKRKLDIKQKKTNTQELSMDLYWNKDLYSEAITSEIELSDKISLSLAYLAPKLIIFDPYLLGTIQKENDKPKISNKSQIVFLNAIIVALTQTEITEITLVGDKKRFKNFNTIQLDELYNNYHLFFDQFKQLSLKNLKILFSNNGFHDRIWCNDLLQSYEKIRLLKPSNSISGLCESGEFSLDLINEKEKYRRVKILTDRLNDCTELKFNK